MSYHELERTFYRLAQLDHASEMLQWDRYVMMPPGGNAARSRALAELDVMRTEILQDPAMDERVERAREANDLSDWQLANLRQMTLDWKRARALPKALVEAQSLASSECEHAWRTLRPDNNWRDFQPLLQRVFDLAREAAQAQREALSEERGFANDYDALLDQFDPGTLMHRIDPVFDRLKSTLPDLTRDILERQATRPTPVTPANPVPVDKQDALARDVMAVLGFNFDAGRLDPTAHPFSGGAPEDSRVTTRYD